MGARIRDVARIEVVERACDRRYELVNIVRCAHLRNAYARLGAHGRVDALIKVRALGLLDGTSAT
jgi:hypothetical protein